MSIHHSFIYIFFTLCNILSLEAVANEVESVCVCDPVGDSLALVALYDATGGENWTNVWDLEQAMDTWYGVTVNENGCVICLDLNDNWADCSRGGSIIGNNLVGTIPTALGHLTDLQFLYLMGNQLSGNIPTELGSLSNLEVLELGFNNLDGIIPASLGNLSNLKTLHLTSNNLEGEIPNTLGNLSNLERLYLSSNQLTGNIPSELGNLSNLIDFYLHHNQLTGSIPSELGNLTSLVQFRVQSNQLSGTIPPELGNFPNLQTLRLDRNNLTGSIPPELEHLENAININFSYNQLSGEIPAKIMNITKLYIIDFSYNQLSGTIPSEIENLFQLKYLHLEHNLLSGPIPTSFGNLLTLEYLYLQHNQISGPIPASLGNLPTIYWLYLHDNQFSGHIPASLGNLNTVNRLYLHNNQLEGCFPTTLHPFCDLGFSTDLNVPGYNFTNNPNLFHQGDFAAFCENLPNVCCLSIAIIEQSGPTCEDLGSVLLSFVNVSNGIYNIDYEGGSFENIEVIDGQATLHFTEAGTYNNLSITIDDCTSTENPTAVIDPISTTILSLNEINHPETCDAIGSVDFNVEGYIGELYTLDYSWRDGEPSGGPDFRAISNIPAGSHFIAVIGDCHFFTDTLFLTVAPFCTDVWPGDADNSGQVNFVDALSVILKNEKTGPVRPNASETWEAQLAADWEDLSPDGVDAKHADGDGDGVVNPLEDLGVVAQNYLKTISDSPNPPDQLFLLQDYVLMAERSDIQQLDGTTTVTFDLKLKNNTAEILEVAGLGFLATYQNGANPRLESTESGLGIEGDDLITFSHILNNDRMDGAIGRTDTQNVIIPAFEDLLITKFIIDEDIVTLDVEDPANNSISLNFKEILIVNNKGDQFHLGGSTASSHTGQQDDGEPFTNPLSIALSATHAINCPEAATASISPAGGVPPYQYLWEDGQTTASVSQLDPGTYYATVSDATQEEIAGLIMIDGTTSCSLPLALENLNFQATAQTNHILLTWTLNHQINTAQFDIERSIDGYNFNTIARKTTNEQTYPTAEFEDHDVQPKQIYYYRLNMLVQGQSEYSTVVEVTAPSISSPSFHFFPNPVTNKLTIANKQALSKPTEIVVFNAFGQKVQQSVFYQPLSLFILDFEAFSSGLYFISVQTDGEAFGFKVWKE